MPTNGVSFARTRSAAKRVALAVVVAIAATGGGVAHEFRTDTLHIVHPYTTEPAEAAPATAAVYMVIHNTSAGDDRLLAARSPLAKVVALQTKQGPSTTALALPAASKTTVGPEAVFIEMRELTESLEGYQYFPMTLVFERAGAVEIEVFLAARQEQPNIQQKPQ